MAIHLGSTLDPCPEDYCYPSFFDQSEYFNFGKVINECRLPDGSLLKDADGKWGKAYSYWVIGPYNDNEWAQLALDAPDEVHRVGQYLITAERLNIEATHITPEWMLRKFECNSQFCKFVLLAFLISSIAVTIITLRIKNKI